jgi:deoxyribodipyrimidine photo-lyase
MLDRFLKPVPKIALRRKFTGPPIELPTLDTAACQIDHSVAPVAAFRGGRKQALRRLDEFLRNGLHRYPGQKNEPCAQATSNLSPYLHAGYISSLEVALQVHEEHRERKVVVDEFLEELIVRRELAFKMPPRRSCCCSAESTATTVCIGARKLSSGRPRRKKRSRPCCG